MSIDGRATAGLLALNRADPSLWPSTSILILALPVFDSVEEDGEDVDDAEDEENEEVSWLCTEEEEDRAEAASAAAPASAPAAATMAMAWTRLLFSVSWMMLAVKGSSIGVMASPRSCACEREGEARRTGGGAASEESVGMGARGAIGCPEVDWTRE